MDFTKLLEYQKVDLEFKKLNDEIGRNKDYKTMKAKRTSSTPRNRRSASPKHLPSP